MFNCSLRYTHSTGVTLSKWRVCWAVCVNVLYMCPCVQWNPSLVQYCLLVPFLVAHDMLMFWHPVWLVWRWNCTDSETLTGQSNSSSWRQVDHLGILEYCIDSQRVSTLSSFQSSNLHGNSWFWARCQYASPRLRWQRWRGEFLPAFSYFLKWQSFVCMYNLVLLKMSANSK